MSGFDEEIKISAFLLDPPPPYLPNFRLTFVNSISSHRQSEFAKCRPFLAGKKDWPLISTERLKIIQASGAADDI